MIHIIRSRATKQQVEEMREELLTLIKLAVDVQRSVLAGGGLYHADCEEELRNDGSRREDIWGAGWKPDSQEITFDSLINIRPGQNNFGMEIADPMIRNRVEQIVRQLLEGV